MIYSSLHFFIFAFLEKMMENGLVTPIKAPTLTTKPPKMAPSVGVGTSPLQNSVLKKPKITTFQLDTRKCCQNSGTYATSSCAQALLLLHRSFLILYRDRSLTAMRITIHTCVALLVGTLYFGIGNDASMVFNNFRYVFLSIMFLMFTSYSSSSLSCNYKFLSEEEWSFCCFNCYLWIFFFN